MHRSHPVPAGPTTRARAVGLPTCLLAAAALLPAQEPVREIPAFTAFATPDADAMRRERDGSVPHWRGTLTFYGHFAAAGEVEVALRLLPDAQAGTLELAVGEERRTAEVAPGAAEVVLGRVPIAAGYRSFALRAVDGQAPGLRQLVLRGTPAEQARFSTVERRNAASVHLGYPVPKERAGEVEWFYCEITPRTDPLWTYYMATGWHRGYFGIQVNSPTERRVIFSVWDSGNEGIDRRKVAAEDRVQLVRKGSGVVAEGFGNEGTGGHSHLVRDWRVGDTCRFLVHAEPEGTHTTYTGWYWFAERAAWGLIASFRAPKDGGRLRGLYSFNENFSGSNGQERRHCEFAAPWIGTPGGEWLPLLQARFTHDGHGERERLDRAAGTTGTRFWLANGGFVEPAPDAITRAHDPLELPASGLTRPAALDDLPH